MTETPTPASGVIHDIGYRGYDGERLGRFAIARSLFVTSLRSTFGLGRTAKSKVLPFILFGFMLLPAFVLEIVLIFGRSAAEQAAAAGGGQGGPIGDAFSAQLVPYTGYAIVAQAIIGIFLASQAPQLFSRDLRFHTISLYFSRPLTRVDYVVSKYLALVGGLLILIVSPLIVMFAGGLLAELPLEQELAGFAQGLGGALILSLLLAGVGALVSSLTVRRGFAVAIIITIGTVTLGVAGALRGIGEGMGSDLAVGLSGLLSPLTLLDGVQNILFDATFGELARVPEGVVWPIAYIGTTALVIAGAFGLLLLRYRKVSGA